MMKPLKIILISIITFMLSIDTYACECPIYRLQELDSLSLASNEIVLIGTITSINEYNYEIHVKHILKGNLNVNQLTGIYSFQKDAINYCSFFPNYKTDYLLYLTPTEIEGKTYYFSSLCEGSRSLDLRQTPEATHFSLKELESWTEEWINKLK